jgi:hypothetical protein
MTTFIQQMLPKVQKATIQQTIFRWGITLLVIILAALGYWNWAWLTLALAVFASVIDIGFAMVCSMVNLMATQLPPTKTSP